MNRYFFLLVLIMFGCKIQDSDDRFKVSLKEAYFGRHFMIGLDSMKIVFDSALVTNFQRLGKDRDWINTETETGENVLNLYDKITTQGEYIDPKYSFNSGVDSIFNKNIYPCRCSKGYFWKDYTLIYCEIVISSREKFTQNLFFKKDSLIFSQDSGKLMVN